MRISGFATAARLTATAFAVTAFLPLAGGLARGETPDLQLADHPLVGSIWQTSGGNRVDEAALIAAAEAAKWVLLGEKHDNPEHHRLQARMVTAVAAAGRRPALVWEMAGPDQSQALAAAKLEDVASLGAALDWEKRGWYTWSIYRPIAEAALAHGLKMYPGNPSPETTRAVGRGKALPPDLKARLNWALEYDSDQHAALTAMLATSHCGALPESALAPMADVQRLRDAWMAASLREADRGDGAILIAGAQHVREDRGVPWRLGEDVFSLALVEVADGQFRAQDYPSFDARLFDFVWFTARIEEEDLCAKFFGKSSG